MLIYEDKLDGSKAQFAAIEEAIRTTQFIRNKCLRLWMDARGVSRNDLQRSCAVLARQFPLRSPSTLRPGKLPLIRRGLPSPASMSIASRRNQERRAILPFQHDCRSVEDKQTGWKLDPDGVHIRFTDGCGIGRLRLIGSRDIMTFPLSQIKRVRLLRRADGYSCQFAVAATRRVEHQPSGKQVGIDLGLRAFFTDSEGNTVAPPQDLRKAERRLKRLHRRLSKTQKRSRNRRKARQALSKASLKVQRQREDVARKTANALVSSHDVIAYEALQIRHLVKNCHLAKRIADAAWGRFLSWVRYDGTLHRVPVIGMEPAFTTQNCSRCGQRVKKSLRMRTHLCPGCGLLLDRDHNAALNILHKALQGTVEQTRTDEEVSSNASGQPAVRVVALRRLARIQAEGRIPALLAWGVSISIPFKEAIAFDESFDPSRVPVKGSPCEGAEVPWSPDASLRLKEEVIDLLSNLRLPLSLSPLSLHADNKGTLDPFPDKMMYSNAFWKRG